MKTYGFTAGVYPGPDPVEDLWLCEIWGLWQAGLTDEVNIERFLFEEFNYDLIKYK
jgi:hypothetical protein